MEKFTKGEWWSDSGMSGNVIFSSNGPICRMSGHNEDKDANLIAAAPDMYKMLKCVLGEMHMLIDEVNKQRASNVNPQTENQPDYHDQETLHLIQCLLAKARGE